MKAIGVDIGGTKISAGYIFDGHLVNQVEVATKPGNSTEVILKNLYDTIDQVYHHEVDYIGIGLPGFINAIEGIVEYTVNIPAFNGLNLVECVENTFRKKTFIENDANCFVKGVQIFGAGKGHRHIAGITLGTGIGTGLILNGKLYHGLLNGAGEFGQIPYLEGTFEDYCSGKFFDALGKNGKEMYRLAYDGNTEALEIWQKFGSHIAGLLTLVLYSVAPEMIVFGGSVSQGFPFFARTMYDTLSGLPVRKMVENVRITYEQGKHSALYGAAALGYVIP